jgi:hypothetical protein
VSIFILFSKNNETVELNISFSKRSKLTQIIINALILYVAEKTCEQYFGSLSAGLQGIFSL